MEKKQSEMTEQELLSQPKEQVIDRQFKNNCDYGFKQPNVNKFIRMAFESGFENGMNYQKYSNLDRESTPVTGMAEEAAKNYESNTDLSNPKAVYYAFIAGDIYQQKAQSTTIERLTKALEEIIKTLIGSAPDGVQASNIAREALNSIKK